MAMSKERRNEIGYLAFKMMMVKRGAVTLKDEPMDFAEMAKDIGGDVSAGEAKEFYGAFAQELLNKMLGK